MQSQDTDLLIEKLVSGLRPVWVLPRPLVRCLLWGTMTISIIVIIVRLLGGPRPDILNALHNLYFVSDTVLIFAAAMFSSLAAFHLVIPRVRISRILKALLGAATCIWVVLCIRCFLGTPHSAVEWQPDIGHLVHHCLIDLALLALVPAGVIFVMMRQGASTHLLWAGYAAVLASTSFAALGMRYLCPIDSAGHLLAWHFLPVLFYAAIGPVVGKFFLRW